MLCTVCVFLMAGEGESDGRRKRDGGEVSLTAECYLLRYLWTCIFSRNCINQGKYVIVYVRLRKRILYPRPSPLMTAGKAYLFKVGVPAPGFYFDIILLSYDYNMHIEGLLPANLCLVTLLSSDIAI